MSNIKYVIRRNEFSYNDEYYSTHSENLSTIEAIYTNKAEAEQAYKTLVVQALYEQNSLYDYNGDTEISQQLQEFIEENEIQVELEEDEDLDELETMPEMSEEDAFKFAQQAGLLWYQFLEFDDSKPVYVIWLNQSQKYLDGEYNNIIDSQDENFTDLHSDQYMYLLESEFEDYFQEDFLNQHIKNLTESPELLKTLIQDIQAIQYDDQQHYITEIDWNELEFIQLKSLNTLLKHPLFEIHQMTLEQFAQLTQGKEYE